MNIKESKMCLWNFYRQVCQIHTFLKILIYYKDRKKKLLQTLIFILNTNWNKLFYFSLEMQIFHSYLDINYRKLFLLHVFYHIIWKSFTMWWSVYCKTYIKYLSVSWNRKDWKMLIYIINHSILSISINKIIIFSDILNNLQVLE